MEVEVRLLVLALGVALVLGGEVQAGWVNCSEGAMSPDPCTLEIRGTAPECNIDVPLDGTRTACERYSVIADALDLAGCCTDWACHDAGTYDCIANPSACDPEIWLIEDCDVCWINEDGCP